jgi:hypothetical protein
MEKNQTNLSNGSRSSSHSLTVSAVLYGSQASFSLMANLLVVFLFVCRRHLLYNPHNRCILSLAIADVFTSISVLTNPGFVVGEEIYNPKGHNYLIRELYCRVVQNKFLPFALGVTSVYTSVVLAFERWLAVRRSIFYKSRFKIRHMNVLIIASWILGFITEVPLTAFSQGVHNHTALERCQYTFTQNKMLTIFLSTGLLVLQAIIPSALMTLAYIDVFRGIKASLLFAASHARVENINGIKRLKKVTSIAAVTTFVVTVCWLPPTIEFCVSLLVYEKPVGSQHDAFLGLLAFANGCINPCIYVYSNPDLRNAVKDIFR